VKSISYREISVIRRIFFIIFSILTLGGLPLACHWVSGLFVVTNYRKSDPEKASKIIITDDFNTTHVCDKKTVDISGYLLNYFEYKKLRYMFNPSTRYFFLCFFIIF
jgi:hypothetical protein